MPAATRLGKNSKEETMQKYACHSANAAFVRMVAA